MYYLKQSGLVLTVLVGLVSCSALTHRPEAPIVSLSDIKFSKMGLLEQNLILTLRLKNPNDYSLPLRGLNYVLKLNGHEFAEGVSASRVTIAPYGEAMIDVNVISNFFSIFKQLKGLSGKESLKYSLSGKIGLVNKAFKLPFSRKGELSF